MGDMGTNVGSSDNIVFGFNKCVQRITLNLRSSDLNHFKTRVTVPQFLENLKV
jgi:hypothetical protein